MTTLMLTSAHVIGMVAAIACASKMPEYTVTADLWVVAEDLDMAVRYIKEMLREVNDRDLDGPGAAQVTDEPWLSSFAVDNRAEEVK
jgi:hypothetical protein